MSSVIFKSGYIDGDDELMAMKGHRSDVLYRDDGGFCYELNFISIDRLHVELKRNIEHGENYFSDTGLVVLDAVNRDSIIKSVLKLCEKKYFTAQKSLKIAPEQKWFVVNLGVP